jgi:hypothetical protein
VYLGSAAGTLTFSGAVGTNVVDVNVTKVGVGTVSLTQNDTYGGPLGQGTTTVNAGILNIQANNALGSATGAATVNTGGTLQLQGGITVANPLTLNGAGAGTLTGALDNLSGNNTESGVITLTSATTITSEAGTLSLTAAMGQSGGAENLTVSGAGSVKMSGAASNSYTGTTSVIGGGTLVLAQTGGAVAINGGAITVGDNATGIATLTLQSSNEISGSPMVTVDSNGVINGAGNATIGALAMQAGAASGATISGTGLLTLGGDVSLSFVGTGATPDNSAAARASASIRRAPEP